MKSKRDVANHLRNKLTHWLNSNSCNDMSKKTKNLINEHSLIAGNSIACLYRNEKVNDYDVYFKDIETVINVVSYYIDQINKKKGTDYHLTCRPSNDTEVEIITNIPRSGLNVISDYDYPPDDYNPIIITRTAITLANGIQLVYKFVGKGKDVVNEFDFLHTKAFWQSNKPQDITMPYDVLENIRFNMLKYTGSKYPISSIIRAIKYTTKRDWVLSASDTLKICLDINGLDLSNQVELEAQMLGVDLGYFSAIIDALTRRDQFTVHDLLDMLYDDTLLWNVGSDTPSELPYNVS